MLYSFVRPIATIALKTFFKKIYFTNAAKIPVGKPVIIAANHPTAFLEPCILACLLDQPLHFLVRGNLFKKPLHNKVLRALHMLPVFRTKDSGLSAVKQNYETFDACYDTLRDNKPIMILAEGHTNMEKRLQPLKKGTARLAFGTLEKYPDLEDVFIVPTGVNYTYADRFRSEAMIDFGDVISTRDYWADYVQNPNNGISILTEVLRKKMEERIIGIKDPEDEKLVEQFFVVNRNEHQEAIWPVVNKQLRRLKLEKGIANTINDMPEAAKKACKSSADAYFEMLGSKNITDRAVVARPVGILHVLLLILGFIPFIFGYALNYLPLRLAKKIADDKVRQIEFYTSVMVAVAMGAYLIYSILAIAICLLAGAGWWSLCWFAVPFLGAWALSYQQLVERYSVFQQQKKCPKSDLEALRQKRSELLGFMKK